MATNPEVLTARELYDAFLVALNHEAEWHCRHCLTPSHEVSCEFNHGFAAGLRQAHEVLRELAIHLLSVQG